MIKFGELSLTPFRGTGHGTENILLESRDLCRCIRQVLPLLKLNFEAILSDVLARLLQLLAGWIFEYCPEIGYPEDYGCTLECGNEAGGVIDVRLYDIYAFGLPGFGGWGRDIAGYASDFPAWSLKVNICD